MQKNILFYLFIGFIFVKPVEAVSIMKWQHDNAIGIVLKENSVCFYSKNNMPIQYLRIGTRFSNGGQQEKSVWQPMEFALNAGNSVDNCVKPPNNIQFGTNIPYEIQMETAGNQGAISIKSMGNFCIRNDGQKTFIAQIANRITSNSVEFYCSDIPLDNNSPVIKKMMSKRGSKKY